jgi:hypothetical protein
VARQEDVADCSLQLMVAVAKFSAGVATTTTSR